MSPEHPIIIGVADVKNRHSPSNLSAAKEPLSLILEAIHLAIHDACPLPSSAAALQARIDSVDVVRTWTWPYADLPGLVARGLGVEDGVRWKAYSEHGGDKPGKLLDEACRRVGRGGSAVAVVTGGEALASLSAFAAAGQLPPPGWTAPEQVVDSVFTPTGRDLGDSMVSTLWQRLSGTHSTTDLGAIHQIGAPIHVYPLYENAFRAHRGQSIKENHAESARLYAEFSKIAARHPYAWNSGKADSEEDIGTVGKKNRMICSPYPLLMNAFNTVNLASAILITTPTIATSLNIPPSKWIYPLGGAGTHDSAAFWERPNFYSSPSISRSIDAALHVSHTTKQDIDLYDIYSCFPIVPKLAAAHLGLPITRGEKNLSLLGGLTSFGGAGNNYSMHALTEMTRQLRDGKGSVGLVLCNGGVLTYQYVVVLSREQRRAGEYPAGNPLHGHITNDQVPHLVLDPEGEAVVETYTVEFNRDGSPLRGYIVGRLQSNGKRFLANHGDENTLRQMAEATGEIVGRSGWVRQDSEKKGRGLFTFGLPAKL